jgi:hypothetical protein
VVGWCVLVPDACIIIVRAGGVVGAGGGGVGVSVLSRDVESSAIGSDRGLQA